MPTSSFVFTLTAVSTPSRRVTEKNPIPALKQRERFAFAAADLAHRALLRRFVLSPAQNFCAVSKSAAGKMIVGDFDHDLWIDRLPFTAAFRAPAARPSRRVAGESRRFSPRLQFFCQRAAFFGFERRRETDVVK